MDAANSLQPLRIAVFPRIAQAALRAGEAVDLAAWSLLRAIDSSNGGAGLIARRVARDAIAGWRGDLDPRSVRRIISRGESLWYWTTESVRGADRLRLAGAHHVMHRLGVEAAGAQHLIPIDRMRTPAAIRASLYATVHPLPNHSGAITVGPISRRRKEQLTGISPRTQQRYDNEYGASELVQECYGLIETHEGPPVTGKGYYPDQWGRQWKRLPDLRTPTDHWLGSKSAATHANRKAAALRDHVGCSGAERCHPYGNNPRADLHLSAPEQPARVFYVSGDEGSARRTFTSDCWICAGTRAEICPHRSGVIAFGPPGHLRFTIREPKL